MFGLRGHEPSDYTIPWYLRCVAFYLLSANFCDGHDVTRGGAEADRGREHDGLLWCMPRQSRQDQTLSGAGETRWQASDPGPLRHRRGGGVVRRAVAGGAGDSGGADCSGGGAAADERGGAAAGAGGGANADLGREQVGLLWSAGVVRRQACEPGHVRHRRGGRAEHRAVAGGAGGGGAAGCSNSVAHERGSAAAGAGGGADVARGREQDGLLWRRSPGQHAQALPGAGAARWHGSEPGLLRHRRGGGTVHCAIAGGAGGSATGCSGGAADEQGGATAGAGREAHTARGREQDGLLRSAPHQARPAQALSGAGEARWQGSAPGQLRHRRGGGIVRRAFTGVAGGSGGAGCSGAAAAERGDAAAGAGGGADTARGAARQGGGGRGGVL
eukprot:scaffold47972_cov55-Phaeocystis_antarctica.AAC.3